MHDTLQQVFGYPQFRLGQHRTDRFFLAQTKLWITEDLLEGVVHRLSLH